MPSARLGRAFRCLPALRSLWWRGAGGGSGGFLGIRGAAGSRAWERRRRGRGVGGADGRGAGCGPLHGMGSGCSGKLSHAAHLGACLLGLRALPAPLCGASVPLAVGELARGDGGGWGVLGSSGRRGLASRGWVRVFPLNGSHAAPLGAFMPCPRPIHAVPSSLPCRAFAASLFCGSKWWCEGGWFRGGVRRRGSRRVRCRQRRRRPMESSARSKRGCGPQRSRKRGRTGRTGRPGRGGR